MEQSNTITYLQRLLAERLAAHTETSLLDAQVLLAQAAGQTRAWVLAHPEAELSPAQLDWLEHALHRLEAGEPLPYVLGKWEFFGLAFAVTPAVLIPRPETELLVEQALGWARQRQAQGGGRLRIADVGTGSGCIAVSLALSLPQTTITAIDLSWQALRVAQHNAQAHGVAQHLHLAQADLLSSFTEHSFDLVCANLPYVPTDRLRDLPIFGKEPTLALDGGADGLVLIRRLLQQAQACLAPGGLLLAEIEVSLGEAALALAQAELDSARAAVLQDYTGRDRLLRVEFGIY